MDGAEGLVAIFRIGQDVVGACCSFMFEVAGGSLRSELVGLGRCRLLAGCGVFSIVQSGFCLVTGLSELGDGGTGSGFQTLQTCDLLLRRVECSLGLLMLGGGGFDIVTCLRKGRGVSCLVVSGLLLVKDPGRPGLV